MWGHVGWEGYVSSTQATAVHRINNYVHSANTAEASQRLQGSLMSSAVPPCAATRAQGRELVVAIYSVACLLICKKYLQTQI